MKVSLEFCAVLLICAHLDIGHALSKFGGGCLHKGSPIPSNWASELNKDLDSRINDIKYGKTEEKTTFHNREGCLPDGYSYTEYKLYPAISDKNRIVVQEENEVFYFTNDHYRSFYKILAN